MFFFGLIAESEAVIDRRISFQHGAHEVFALIRRGDDHKLSFGGRKREKDFIRFRIGSGGGDFGKRQPAFYEAVAGNQFFFAHAVFAVQVDSGILPQR